MDNEVKLQFRNSVTQQGKLDRYAEQLRTIKSALSGIDTNTINSIKESSEELKDISNKVKDTSKKINFAFNFGIVNKFASGLKKVVTEFSRITSASSGFLEDFNLFQVSFEGNYQNAEKFVNKLSEMYGLDERWLIRTTGIFKQLSNAMELSTENGEKLSKLMTQMSIDISSLYNINPDRASSILQSALAGQTKPVRSLGADITQATLQTTLDNIDLGKQVNQLSYAEKRLLIIVSLTQQLSESTGDWGRTLESPSNQLRILNEQWQRLTRAVGNVFLPILAKILPYLNATLMVLTEIIGTFASFLGFNMGEFDYFDSAKEDITDFNDGLGSANENVKKLKQGLRGFDKLNVITTSTQASGGLGGNINPKLLDAFSKAFDNYNSKLDNVTMKATKIRDAIMETLGFTKEIDPLTGKITWKYQGWEATVKGLVDFFSSLSFEARFLVGLGIATYFVKIYQGAKSLLGVLGATGIVKQLGSIYTTFKLMKSLGGGTLSSFFLSFDEWKKNAKGIEITNMKLSGLITTGVGLYAIKKSMDSINESGLKLSNTLGLVGGSLGTILGATQIGASIGGGPGAVIGFITGSVVALTTALANYKNEHQRAMEAVANKTKEALVPINEYNQSLKDQFNQIEENNNQQAITTGVHQTLLDELMSITDENGKIKLGYEDRANFITTTLSKAYGVELEINGGIIKNYQTQIDKIKELIENKKKEVAINLATEKYELALKNQSKAYTEMTKAETAHKDVLSELESALGVTKEQVEASGKNFYEYARAVASASQDKSLKKLIDTEIEAQKTLDESSKSYYKTQQEIMNYNGLVEAVAVDNKEAIDYYTNNLLSSHGREQQSYKDMIEEAKKSYDARLQYAKEHNQQINEAVLNSANEQLRVVANTLVQEVKNVEDVTPDFVYAWEEMSKQSEDIFLQYFEKLPKDVQKEVVEKMQNKGYKISEELQKGISKINPEIKFKANTEDVNKKVSNIFTLFDKQLKLLGITIPNIGNLGSISSIGANGFASGGMPTKGQLFYMNEKEPEFLGNIGGKTFVANQNQMMDLLDKKIGNAQTNSGTEVFNIYLDKDNKLATYTLNKVQKMAKNNGEPIIIGG